MSHQDLIEERRLLTIRLDRPIDHTRYEADVKERIQAMNGLKAVREALCTMSAQADGSHLTVPASAGRELYAGNAFNND